MGKPPQKPIPSESQQTSVALTQAETVAVREKVEKVIGPIVGGSQRVQVVERVTQMISSYAFRGPLPHPEHLQAYEDTCRGSADRIIKMAEIAQERREGRRDKALEHEFSDRRLGMILGFAALVLLLCTGTVIVALGQVAIGSTLLGAGVLGTVVGTFIHGRKPGEKPEKAAPDKQANPEKKDG